MKSYSVAMFCQHFTIFSQLDMGFRMVSWLVFPSSTTLFDSPGPTAASPLALAMTPTSWSPRPSRQNLKRRKPPFFFGKNVGIA